MVELDLWHDRQTLEYIIVGASKLEGESAVGQHNGLLNLAECIEYLISEVDMSGEDVRDVYNYFVDNRSISKNPYGNGRKSALHSWINA